MGNTKFKFSNMIPNAWFYKLRDMGKNNRYRNTTKKTHATSSSSSSFSNSSSLFSSTDSNSTFVQHKTKQPQILHLRKSYYFTRDLSPPHLHSVIDTKLQNSPIKSPKQRKSPNSPNISQKQKIRNRVASEKANYVIPISVDPNKGFCNAKYNTLESNSIGFDPISEKNSPNSSKLMTSKSILRDNPNCQISIQSDSENSVPNSDNHNLDSNASGFYPNSKSKLPRIITKKEIKAKKEKNIITPKKQTVFTGVRLRTNSPRIGKVNESGRKSFNTGRKIPESFAVVKSSLDPKRDFRESMVEMILANDIKSSKELEDLLFCFLELNCDVYHEVIIEVFKQIWFDLVYVSV